ERDNRVLVIVDGCLLPESFSHNGEIVQSIPLCELSTKAQQVRSPEPYYEGMVDLPFVPRQHYFDKRTGEVQVNINRYFLLLPVKTNAVFVRPRDMKSLGPMYTFIEVDVENDKPVVRWRNTSW
ncbi:MAG: hypothetical protein NTY66_00180, partial [Candidatus Vogelbacteria bacterium]|nr:hypothetical protein [Candidatus Vogelbacteria bacterium]